MNSVRISVVAPCHNEEEVIGEFHRRLSAAMTALGMSWEVVYVDDGSSDRTPEILRDICANDARATVLRLSRCFGHQLALTAGLDHVRGDAVVIIDSDLQDPPELISDMVARWRAGAQVVYGRRLSRDGETIFKLVAANAFYWLINLISDVRIPTNVGDFRLMDRVVVDALRSMPEQHRMLRAMISWLGFRQEMVPYHRDRRYAGATKYSLTKMMRLALDGLVSSSSVPLRIVSTIGLVALASAMSGAAVALIRWAATGEGLPDSLTMLLTVALFSGVQLFCFGVMGEYIGRIYGEVKRRPLYLISERLGAGASRETRREPEPTLPL